MSIKRNEFIQAYKWYYFETIKKANEVYDRAVCCGDYDFINEIIDLYRKNNICKARLYD